MCIYTFKHAYMYIVVVIVVAVVVAKVVGLVRLSSSNCTT